MLLLKVNGRFRSLDRIVKALFLTLAVIGAAFLTNASLDTEYTFQQNVVRPYTSQPLVAGVPVRHP